MKVVMNSNVNSSFVIPEAVVEDYCESKGISVDECDWHLIKRDDPDLVYAVDTLNDEYIGDLVIVEIPDGIEWEIFIVDDQEIIVEKGHYWTF